MSRGRINRARVWPPYLIAIPYGRRMIESSSKPTPLRADGVGMLATMVRILTEMVSIDVTHTAVNGRC